VRLRARTRARTAAAGRSRNAIYTSPVVTVSFTFSRAESRRAMSYLALRNRGAVLMVLLGLALLAAGAGTGKTALLVVGGAELGAWVFLVLVLPRTGSRGVAERGTEQTLSFSEDGVTAANSNGEGSFDWRHWTRWSSVGELYVLQGGRRAVTFVPRRAFATPESESEFRELLARHIGKR
jgi:hypothetical protein